MGFRVELNQYRGPLDLLLYLVRRHEVEIRDLPLAAITEQYLAHLDVLRELNVDDVGDFLELASTLIELKSKQALPRAEEEEAEEVLEDAREDLVQRLLAYKRYRDAASMLEDRSRRWQQRYERQADDLPPRKVDPAEQPIREVELWDLVSAFGRVMRSAELPASTNIVYDETPIQTYMQRISQRLQTSPRVAFSEMFEAGMHKSALVGVFLAILELVRHHGVLAEQHQEHGEIWVVPGASFSPLQTSESNFPPEQPS